MGETSAQTYAEIAQLRAEIAADLEELRRRAERALDVRSLARSRPQVAGAAALAPAALLVLAGLRLVQRRRAEERPEARLRRRIEHLAEPALRRAERLRRRLPVEVSAATRPGGAEIVIEERRPPWLRRAIWALMVAGLSALAGLLARYLAERFYEAALRERPPARA